MRGRLAIGLCLVAGTAAAQAPLSAIDWLNTAPPLILSPIEPPVSDSAGIPEVDVVPLDAPDVASVGLLPSKTTGLPASLWQTSRAETLASLVGDLDPLRHPAMTQLLMTILLAEAEPPSGTDAKGGFLITRIRKLMELGAVDAALALLERAGPETPDLFPLYFDVALLTGAADSACATAISQPRLLTDAASRIYCDAQTGDWQTAVTILQTASALGTLSAQEQELLLLFLNPEAAEGDIRLPPIPRPTPLEFRLYEAIGEPVPTASLDRAFAVVDLNGDAGWKAQLSAAERLARASILDSNRLLGLYTAQRPAASGGLWDRVRGVQDLEAALADGDPAAISAALETLWPLLERADLTEPFATLFGPALVQAGLDGKPAQTAALAGLLSPEFETVAADLPRTLPRRALLAGVATGQVDAAMATTEIERAIVAGFAHDDFPAHLAPLAQRGQLGEVILRAIALFERGATGNTQALSDAIAALRAIGLEHSARRAALHLLIVGAGRA